MTLDDSDFADLHATVHSNRAVAPRSKAPRLPEDLGAGRTLFADPENWERRRGVALVHEESGTVLGCFSEYVHRTVAGARKLVREASPISVSATERVSGSWWLGEGRTVEERRPWHEQRSVVLHLHLSELRVHAPATELVVHLSYGSIARVELAVDTMLRAEEGEGLLFLPAETNVLDVMGVDAKILLRKEVGV